jgi:hypothetical protein
MGRMKSQQPEQPTSPRCPGRRGLAPRPDWLNMQRRTGFCCLRLELLEARIQPGETLGLVLAPLPLDGPLAVAFVPASLIRVGNRKGSEKLGG